MVVWATLTFLIQSLDHVCLPFYSDISDTHRRKAIYRAVIILPGYVVAYCSSRGFGSSVTGPIKHYLLLVSQVRFCLLRLFWSFVRSTLLKLIFPGLGLRVIPLYRNVIALTVG